MQRASLLVLPVLLLTSACGAATLDTTNADTFARTFAELTADIPEADREALARAILAVHADATRERILPRTLPKATDINAFLDPRFRHDYTREIVRSSAATINGKTVAQLLAIAREIDAKPNSAVAKRR